MPTDWRPRAVSLSAGGVRIIGHLGVLARLFDEGILSDVKEWYGTSGGAICAFFCAVGVSAAWIRNCLRFMETAAMAEISEEAIANFMLTWGVNSGAAYIRLLERFVDTWEAGASTWTFADLARERPGIHLGIGALNVSQQRYELLSVDTAPSMRILDAVRASTSIPLFFTPYVDGSGSIYCDGGIIEQFPWRSIPNREQTLVIACSDAEIRDRVEAESHITTIFEYLVKIFHSVRRTFQSEVPRPRHWIAVNNRTIGILDFNIGEKERMALLQEGETAASAWIAFMRQAAASRKQQSRLDHGGQNISSSESRVPGRTSGIPISQIPELLPFQPLHQHSESVPSRRWSV